MNHRPFVETYQRPVNVAVLLHLFPLDQLIFLLRQIIPQPLTDHLQLHRLDERSEYFYFLAAPVALHFAAAEIIDQLLRDAFCEGHAGILSRFGDHFQRSSRAQASHAKTRAQTPG